MVALERGGVVVEQSEWGARVHMERVADTRVIEIVAHGRKQQTAQFEGGEVTATREPTLPDERIGL